MQYGYGRAKDITVDPVEDGPQKGFTGVKDSLSTIDYGRGKSPRCLLALLGRGLQSEKCPKSGAESCT